MYHPYPDDRTKAIESTKLFVSQAPLFLDTETTGILALDEICEIAIVNLAGEVLMNSLVKPAKRVPADATEIHGISNEMVQEAPTFRELLPQLDKILENRTVLVYNLEFDEGKIARSMEANGISIGSQAAGNPEGIKQFSPWWAMVEVEPKLYRTNWHCVMELYAAFYGHWNDYYGSYRWQRLSSALGQCGVELPAGIHRALADAEMTRRLVLHMAGQRLQEEQQPELFNEEHEDEQLE